MPTAFSGNTPQPPTSFISQNYNPAPVFGGDNRPNTTPLNDIQTPPPDEKHIDIQKSGSNAEDTIYIDRPAS